MSLADVMKTAGMSLGSFYSYFGSKHHLVAEACSHTIEATDHLLTSSFTNPGGGYDETVDGYLSAAHRKTVPRAVCLPLLGTEMSHQADAVHAKTSPALEALFENLASKLPFLKDDDIMDSVSALRFCCTPTGTPVSSSHER